VAARTVYPVKYVYFSTMARATETHRLMQEQMPAVEVAPHNISPCSMIREGAVCPPSPPHSSWKPSEEDFKKDGMRVEAAFAAHVARADPEEEESSYSTVLVCHGNVIRYFAMKALQLPVNAWLRTTVANCSISTLVVHSDGHVSLRGLGDCGHLSTEDVTY
jgi:serine/threonine-protein phosphatase PGAM5